MRSAILVSLLAVSSTNLAAQTVTTQYTARLTNSGDAPQPLMPVITDAVEPEAGITPGLHVPAPNAQAPRLLNLVNPAIAIPYNSTIRQVEAFWNGTALPMIDPFGTLLVEEAHSYGPMFPFFKPLFSVAAVPAGPGTLEIRAFDSSHTLVTTRSIPNLSVVRAPAPVATTTIAALPRPRIYLTATRLAAIAARTSNDIAKQRYDAAVQRFLDALAQFPDVTSAAFADRIYDPDNYIPLLALTYQLKKSSDPTTASKCGDAAYTLTMRMATEYDNGTRLFSRDTGYEIRFGLRNLMLAYDWMYDRFTPTDRALLVKVATNWVDWYHNTPGYVESWPPENYYAGYIQGIILTAVATAGDNAAADRFLTLLRSKLNAEVPVLNQRLAGGDWAEGWNYGWYSTLEMALVNTLIKDLGEDWSADFDWLQQLPRSLTFMASPDFSETRSFGGYSGNYPHRTSPATLAVLSTTTTDGAYAGRLYISMNANPNNDFTDISADTFYEMIFAGGGAADVNALGLTYLNSGTGRFLSRSSLTDAQAFFVSAENTSYSFDHYGYSNGDVRLYHGATCLVCPSAYRGNAFDGEAGTPAFSTYLVDGREQVLPRGRNNQNLFTIDNGVFAAIGMRFESSYVTERYDESIVQTYNALDYLIREAVHLRPGTLIVRDLHRRRSMTDTLVGRWHLGPLEAVQTLAPGQYQLGTLKVSTVYPAGVSVSFVDDTDTANNRVGSVMQFTFAGSTAPMELITVFSETLTITSYNAGVLTLSDGRAITFANGTVTTASIHGDVNGDGTVTVADVFYLINSLFAAGPPPIGGGDENGDGSVNVADVFYLINFLFAGGPGPV